MTRPARPSGGLGSTSANKRLVHRLVDHAINGRRFELLDELAADRLAAKLRAAFGQFLATFPDFQRRVHRAHVGTRGHVDPTQAARR